MNGSEKVLAIGAFLRGLLKLSSVGIEISVFDLVVCFLVFCCTRTSLALFRSSTFLR